jgi:hypothetical protein
MSMLSLTFYTFTQHVNKVMQIYIRNCVDGLCRWFTIKMRPMHGKYLAINIQDANALTMTQLHRFLTNPR